MAARFVLAVSTLAFRALALALAVVAASTIGIGGDYGLSAFVYLKMILPLQIVIHSIRLCYDSALVFYHVEPPRLAALDAIAAVDWVMLHVLFAAAVCTLTVEDLLEHDVGYCSLLPRGACVWFKAAGILTFFAWLAAVPATIFTTAAAAAHAEDIE